jgi:hypothetical protein
MSVRAAAFSVALLACCPCTRAQTGSKNAGPVELTVGTQVLRGSAFVLDMGVVRDDIAVEVQFHLRNLTDKVMNLRLVSFPVDVSTEWVEGGIPSAKTTRRVQSKNDAVFLIKWSPTINLVVPTVRIYDADEVIAELGLSSTPAPFEQPITTGGRYTTSARSPSGFYLPTGKPPVGYKLDCNSVKITARAVGNPPADWGCGKGISCTPYNQKPCSPDDGYLIVAGVALTGHEFVLDLSLTAIFRLAEPSPRLRLVSEVARENDSRDKTTACKEDWERFLVSQKAVPQFQTFPPAGDTYRTEPCLPLQSSRVGNTLVDTKEQEWTDMLYAGIRIKTFGKPMLVGFIPAEAKPLKRDDPALDSSGFIIYSPNSLNRSTGFEVRIVRDGKVCVGSFEFGMNASELSSVLVPTNMIAVDQPQPGVHVYTAQVRMLGPGPKRVYFSIGGGRLFAIELENNENHLSPKSSN